MIEELQKKIKEGGYASLNGEERKVWKAHKESLEASEVKGKEAGGEEIITLKKSDLDTIINSIVDKKIAHLSEQNEALGNQLSGVEQGLGLTDWQVWKDPKTGNKTATFRVYREDGSAEAGIIIDRKFHKNEYDENTREHDKMMYKITVLYDDESTKDYIIPLIDLTQMPEMETIEILEQKVDKVFKSSGTVTKTAADGSGYKLYKGGKGEIMAVQADDQVDALVFRDVGTAICKRPSGQVFEVSIDRLNCA